MRRTRVVEVMAALSLTTDLAGGVPFEKGLQVCLAADELAHGLGLDDERRQAVFHAALLCSIGCTSHAPENAALFGDDTAFQRDLKRLDPGDPELFSRQLAEFGSWSARGAELAERFLEVAPTTGPVAATSACEVSRALAPRLGASALAVRALDDVYERWDGLGIPRGRAGQEISLEARVLHAAEQLVLARADRRVADPFAEVRRRAGGHLDPALVRVLDDLGAPLLATLGGPDLLSTVLDREPEPRGQVGGPQLVQLCEILGTVADLKSTHLIGHTQHLADLVDRAAGSLGIDADQRDDLRCGALLHTLGCAVVPSSDLDGSPSAAGLERLRLHAHWTRRILVHCPSLAHLDELTAPAAAHHVSYAEGGYAGWRRAGELPPVGSSPMADLLEAAEAWASLGEPRPGRPPGSPRAVATALEAAVRDGRLHGASVAAVLGAAGRRSRVGADPGPQLTAREIEVLRLTARGLTNAQIAVELGISGRTVGHHLAHVYDKTGRRTRAGVAVWAVERRLLP